MLGVVNVYNKCKHDPPPKKRNISKYANSTVMLEREMCWSVIILNDCTAGGGFFETKDF